MKKVHSTPSIHGKIQNTVVRGAEASDRATFAQRSQPLFAVNSRRASVSPSGHSSPQVWSSLNVKSKTQQKGLTAARVGRFSSAPPPLGVQSQSPYLPRAFLERNHWLGGVLLACRHHRLLCTLLSLTGGSRLFLFPRCCLVPKFFGGVADVVLVVLLLLLLLLFEKPTEFRVVLGIWTPTSDDFPDHAAAALELAPLPVAEGEDMNRYWADTARRETGEAYYDKHMIDNKRSGVYVPIMRAGILSRGAHGEHHTYYQEESVQSATVWRGVRVG